MQNEIISLKIKQLCKENNISINTLIQNCNLSKSFIYDLEKRNTAPSCDKILKIAKFLNVSVNYLLEFQTDTAEIKNARAVTKTWLETTDMEIEKIESLIGTNYATVKLWSVGIGDYFNSRISTLADLMNCSTDYLLGRTNIIELNTNYCYNSTEIAAYGGDGTKGEFTTPKKETT